jgi:hypothetical protein
MNQGYRVLSKSIIALVVLSSLSAVLSYLVIGTDELAKALESGLGDWRYVMGILFTASIAIMILSINLTGGDFGNYLKFKQADKSIHLAFRLAVSIFFLSTIAFTFWSSFKQYRGFVYICVFFGTLAIVEFFLLLNNLEHLRRLHNEFKSQFEAYKKNETPK